jgi:3-isopropylmalate dehydrogenase
MLLDWLARRASGRENFAHAAEVTERAIDVLLADPARRTPDLGGLLGTQAFAAALCEEMGRQLS